MSGGLALSTRAMCLPVTSSRPRVCAWKARALSTRSAALTSSSSATLVGARCWRRSATWRCTTRRMAWRYSCSSVSGRPMPLSPPRKSSSVLRRRSCTGDEEKWPSCPRCPSSCKCQCRPRNPPQSAAAAVVPPRAPAAPTLPKAPDAESWPGAPAGGRGKRRRSVARAPRQSSFWSRESTVSCTTSICATIVMAWFVTLALTSTRRARDGWRWAGTHSFATRTTGRRDAPLSTSHSSTWRMAPRLEQTTRPRRTSPAANTALASSTPPPASSRASSKVSTRPLVHARATRTAPSRSASSRSSAALSSGARAVAAADMSFVQWQMWRQSSSSDTGA
mmetsp:Transcript_6174/g.16773  ORF Transcript_6174/g.16773 Transcript_6174/m.16773 type:complete len:336 (+) Transcript_6174:1192-2199(+)